MSTPKGAWSTRATPIRIPASRARSWRNASINPKIRIAANTAPPSSLEGTKAGAALGESEKSQLAYANALTHWGEAGGYDAEVLFDTAGRKKLLIKVAPIEKKG